MKRIKIFAIAFFVALSLSLATKPVEANEGTAQLTSSTGERARCFASSVLLKDLNYRVLVSCRDLVVPPAVDRFVYSVWAVSVENGRTIKIGDLDVGKAELKTQTAFTEVMISVERDNRARSPSEIILRGPLQQISLLDGQAPVPSPTEISQEPAESFGELIEEPTPTPTVTAQRGVLGGLQRAGLIAIVVIFVVILVIAAITRARG